MNTARPILAAPDPELRAVVVVPARNEEQRIAACVAALAEQHGVPTSRYEVIVILDGCTDATRARLQQVAIDAPELRLHHVSLVASTGVGHARRLGMDLACERLLALGRRDGLIASTDADSVVDDDWLAAQLELLSEGAQAIGGLILLDGAEAGELDSEALAVRSRAAERRMQRVRAREDGSLIEHHQFSGASLALTAAAYERCGGLPVRAALEDEALERSLRVQGVVIHRTRRVRVRTSARTDGRAPHAALPTTSPAATGARPSHLPGRAVPAGAPTCQQEQLDSAAAARARSRRDDRRGPRLHGRAQRSGPA
jgi:glucosyl-3-phosphoglycerate synthase